MRGSRVSGSPGVHLWAIDLEPGHGPTKCGHTSGQHMQRPRRALIFRLVRLVQGRARRQAHDSLRSVDESRPGGADGTQDPHHAMLTGPPLDCIAALDAPKTAIMWFRCASSPLILVTAVNWGCISAIYVFAIYVFGAGGLYILHTCHPYTHDDA